MGVAMAKGKLKFEQRRGEKTQMDFRIFAQKKSVINFNCWK